MHDHPQDPSPAGRRAIPALEWAVGGLGAALVLALIGYLIFQAVWRDELPPDVRLTQGLIHDQGSHWLVTFEAENTGSIAAAQLLIEGELKDGERVVETSQATLDYLPPRSRRQGGLMFRENPFTLDLELRASGYARP